MVARICFDIFCCGQSTENGVTILPYDETNYYVFKSVLAAKDRNECKVRENFVNAYKLYLAARFRDLL